MSDETGKQTAEHPAPFARSAVELKRIIDTEREGQPFLLWRDGDAVQHIFVLNDVAQLTIGRRSSNAVVLADDSEVSRTHAELEQIGEDWTITDDGLSRNGTFVQGTRITQRRRLEDGDVLRIGRTVIEYRLPRGETPSAVTTSGSFLPLVRELTDTQRRVLIALCRPYKEGGRYAVPATNKEIGTEVFLGEDAVKNHLRELFRRFELTALAQNQKRARLVECAFQWGLVSERDL